MRLNIGISWIYTELNIVVYRFGKLEKSWTSATPVNDLKDFNNAIYEACNALDLKKGGNVSIAYESDEHTHEFLELPNMAKKDLQKVLARRIEAEKPFEDAAAWCYHEARHDKRTEGVLLHLMPKRMVDAMIRICDDFFFVAKKLVPLTEIYTRHIEHLDFDREEKLLLIALFENRVQMVVASGSGEILFVRELGYAWRENEGQRLLTDADRTLRYAKQRTGGQITRIIMMGNQSDEAISVLNRTITLPIEIDESSADSYFWSREVVSLPIVSANNFIPKLARSALTKRTALRFSIAALIAMTIYSVIFAGSVEYRIYNNRAILDQAEADIDALQGDIDALRTKMQIAEEERSQLRKMAVTGLDLPVIFFSYIGHFVPAQMVLNEAEIEHEAEGWRFRFTGHTESGFTEVPDLLKKMEASLSARPWNALVDPAWQDNWVAQLKSGAASDDGRTGFELRGVLR